MHVNIVQVFLIIAIAGLCYFVNDQLNNVPILKKVVMVLIVVVAVLCLLQSLGIMNSGISVGR